MTIHRRTFLAAALAGSATLAAGRSFAAAPDPMSKQAVLYDPQAPVLGNPEGDVTVVEWFDYQCPYCKKAYPDVMKIVADDGNIRLVMKDWPIFGPPSEYAAHLTLAAGKYRQQALDALMRTPGRLTDAEIDATLKAAGFDIAALKTAYQHDKARVDGILARNKTQAEGFGFFGTPAYIVGTVVFPGVPEMADFKQAIAEARAKKSR
ncbi:DsbA family protein [Jiella sp. M17.18]|uniref:DsbA family protein n=1 Tax=Jiella sp. M17.18 TaxID=3234247 RepID=UPI0034E024C6